MDDRRRITPDDRVDLSVHTSLSDGEMTPPQAIDLAAKLGVKEIAVADQDCIDVHLGDRYAQYARMRGVKMRPAVELSALWKGRPVEVLGIDIDPKNVALLRKLREAQRARRDHIHGVLKRLPRRVGRADSLANEIFRPEHVSVGASHVVRALLRRRAVRDAREAWTMYDHAERGLRTPRELPSAKTAIRDVLDAGGLPILAHPGLYRDLSIEEMLSDLAPAGLLGVVAWSAYHLFNSAFPDAEASRTFGEEIAALAAKHGLRAVTAGDCLRREEFEQYWALPAPATGAISGSAATSGNPR